MAAIYIISNNGKSLMPTTRYGHVRHLLKEGKAEIYSTNFCKDSPTSISGGGIARHIK